MLFTIPALVAALAVIVVASPIQTRDDVVVDLTDVTSVTQASVAEEIRTLLGEDNVDASSVTANEFTTSGCRDIIFFFAKGSTEPGNLGDSAGPQTANGLRTHYGASRVAVQGIDYAGLLITNLLPGGADLIGIARAKALFQKAASQCPASIIVAGGYSQGAALMHRAIENLSQTVKNQIKGVVTFGDTKRLQDGKQIPKFPKEKLLIICNPGDLVCDGTLIITLAHLDYEKRVPEAVAFLEGKIDAAA